jgi:peptide/nickel transport system permease protein
MRPIRPPRPPDADQTEDTSSPDIDPTKTQDMTLSDWEQDLQRAGFVRQIWRARRWYGADWWFVVLGAFLLLIFVFVAAFPQLVAPHDPAEEVGPAFLAPGQAPVDIVIVGRVSDHVRSLLDLGGENDSIGMIAGSESSTALRQREDELNTDRQKQGLPPIRPDIQRYDTVDQMLSALAKGEVKAAIGNPAAITPLLEKYPTVAIAGPLKESTGQGFVLGTNDLGQDELSRLVWGARVALIVGMSSALASALVGVPLGLASGFVGGWPDRVLTLFMDSLYSFPGLILAIAISAVLGPGIANVIVAIAVLYVPTYYRVVRGQTLAIKEDLYIEAAYSLGASPPTILWRYIFPNTVSSIVVLFSVNVADAILTEAGLSFLGLGLPPDVPDWGIALSRGQQTIRSYGWLITFPGVLIMLVTFAFSILGESLSDILNPRLNRV